jgi:hypothetical protein
MKVWLSRDHRERLHRQSFRFYHQVNVIAAKVSR